MTQAPQILSFDPNARKAETIKTIENYILKFKCIYIKGTKVVGNSKVSSGPLLREVEKRMPKARVDEGSGVRSTIETTEERMFQMCQGLTWR